MWDQETGVAREAAEEAGKILMGLFGRISQVRMKGEIDLVTEADLQAEKKILEIIGRHFPEDSILTEEAGANDKGSERLWIIDPLDGTTNFAHRFPFFAVSIGLQVRQEMVLGMVYNPCLGEFFEAVRQQGARRNNQSIHVSEVTGLKEALLVTGFSYKVHESADLELEYFGRMITRAQGLRRPGSAAIDLCYVAAGICDGFWEMDLHPWDTAAGSIIVQEAGGIVSDYQNQPYDPFRKSILAANPRIHRAMLEILANE